MLCSLWQERERLEKRAEEQRRRADDLYLEKLRLQQELERYKKATYGPRADRLSMNQLAQMLLEFAEVLEQKPIPLEDLRGTEPEPELRRVKRRKGRRALANFENLPVNTQVYELSAEERVCPRCGVERKEIGSEESWQIEYIPGHFERIQHIRKKYACPRSTDCGDGMWCHRCTPDRAVPSKWQDRLVRKALETPEPVGPCQGPKPRNVLGQ